MTPWLAPLLALSMGFGEPVRSYRGPTETDVQKHPDPEPDAPETKEAEPPPPRLATTSDEVIAVAVGLAPSAPGTKDERRQLDELERVARAASDPAARVRRLRPGVGSARDVCRERVDDLVVQIGYVPQRPGAVAITHDCRLDAPLAIRSLAAVDEAFVPELWAEHGDLVDQGYKERRRLVRVKPAVRIALVSSAVVAVLGAAIGVLVASTLRDEKVVLKVSP